MQIADGTAHFFKFSPKRQLALEQWIDVLAAEKKKNCAELDGWSIMMYLRYFVTFTYPLFVALKALQVVVALNGIGIQGQQLNLSC